MPGLCSDRTGAAATDRSIGDGRLPAESDGETPVDARQSILVEREADHPMKSICSWCGVLIRDGREPISHGMCDACTEKW